MNSCGVCKKSVGFFSLSDKVCASCLEEEKSKAKGKLARVFSFSPVWGFLFILGFAAHIYSVYSNVNNAPFSIVMMLLALLALLLAFIIRFYLARRSFNIVFAILFMLPFFAMFSVFNGVIKAGPLAITTLAFIFFPYYVLRTPNLLEIKLHVKTGES